MKQWMFENTRTGRLHSSQQRASPHLFGVQLYERGLTSHPTHAQAHVWCAQAARLCADDWEQALAFCVRSIALRKSPDGYYVLAHKLLLQGSFGNVGSFPL
jgi:hypothetical protein